MQHFIKTAAVMTAASLLAATPALSETQTENIVLEQRTSVSVQISPDAAQAFMPKGWVANAAPGAGPTLTLIFMDRDLQLLPDGKPMNAGVNRLLILAMAGKNAATGEVRSMIVGGYSADPAYAPGAYKVNRPGDVAVTRTDHKAVAAGKFDSRIEEHWTVKGVDGGTVAFDLAWTRGVPTLRPFEQKNYSGALPDFYRIYRGRQASEVLRDGTVNHVTSVMLKATGGLLGKAVDGTEKITTISNAPYYSRLTFLP